MLRRLGLGVLCMVMSQVVLAANTGTVPYLPQKKVQSFIQTMVKKYEFNQAELESLFKQVKYNPNVIKFMTRPAEKWGWEKYQKQLVSKKRAEQGAVFWQKHVKALQRAQYSYNVPAQIIVAIIGVESSYGRNKGGFSVLDALSTLAFDYPRREKFFTKELTNFLLLSREEKWNPLQVQSSYAGAIGQPQFMPSSYRHYAIDFSHDGKRDLINNQTDVIGSVANYFKKHGWKGGQPVAIPAKVSGQGYKKITKLGLKPKYSVKKLRSYGITPKQRVDQSLKAALVVLDGKHGPEYWLTFQDFYAITRYNHSPLYAMAVYELSQQILHYRQLALADRQTTSHV